MKKTLQLTVLPEIAGQSVLLKKRVAGMIGCALQDITHIEIVRRSIDARKAPVKLVLSVEVYLQESFEPPTFSMPDYPNVANAEEIIIIGAGPAGLFAALTCLEMGKKPVILERGKDARERIKDIKGINVHHIVNPDSNYCFGEGGAGTYSDGKLYTRSKKRGNVRKLLETLVAFGATTDILVDAHPHIGTNKLPGIISTMRKCIIENGGKVFFNTRVTEFILESDHIKGVKTLDGTVYHARNVILATGHSARDIFEQLDRQSIEIEAKPISIGVRVEHPQALIDQIQYHCDVRGDYLPAAPYSIVKQVEGRGVYSFCMCPGGVIAPCATQQEEIVTNGWSSSRRARSTANSGIVVSLDLKDYASFQQFGPLAGVEYQKAIERAAWEMGGRTQTAPAQRLEDFVQGKLSESLPVTSYAPGITSVDLKNLLPSIIHESLVGGFKQINRSMKGYLTNEATVHAPETRTSSPVRIPRDPKTLQHIRIKGLYPCGEGAGYAGGIVSAGLDGERCAQAACGKVANTK